ncbi:MAG TPA: adenylate/guanylate cyclase domain-containing protein [Ramlibacter sp.]|jgi:class 3 adenylate cyclase/tetratricopeptide (TPR) repeat protein|nr:adenylate/guanylate cyclase domain-containing protein [Ramlibacter sp.]
MPSVRAAASPRFTRTARVIAVADVVESVRLMEHDEQRFIAHWQRFVAFVVESVTAASGRVHKSLGDGLMLEFNDPQGCVRTMLAMQEWFRATNAQVAPEEHVHLRIGAHVADYVADKYDIYGTDVNLATRIASLAGPGEIVISAALRDRLGRIDDVPLQDLGSCHLKHVKQPVHAYRLGAVGRNPVMHAQPAAAVPMRATLAVLPFRTDGESLNGIGGDTLADELVAVVAHSDVLQVVSRMTTAPLHGARHTLSSVLAEVGAHYVLTGRARVHEGALALYAELADARTGHVIWAHSFQGVPRASGTIDGVLLGELVAAVHAAVIRHEVEAAQGQPMPALEGATLLLASLGLMHRLSPVDMDRARGMLEHLMERWRRHASAHAWLAHLHVLRVQQGGAGITGHDQALARAYGASAVQCDPASPLVLAVDGHATLHGAGNHEGAADRYAQALSVRADHSLALLFRAELLAMQGSARQARHTAARALQTMSLDPLRYLYDAIAAFAAWADGDAAQAAQLAEQALQRNPRYLPAWRTLLAAQVDGERLGDARATQQRLLRRQPAFNVASFLAATPICDPLAQRLADNLLRAGVPRG